MFQFESGMYSAGMAMSVAIVLLKKLVIGRMSIALVAVHFHK